MSNYGHDRFQGRRIWFGESVEEGGLTGDRDGHLIGADVVHGVADNQLDDVLANAEQSRWIDTVGERFIVQLPPVQQRVSVGIGGNRAVESDGRKTVGIRWDRLVRTSVRYRRLTAVPGVAPESEV